MKTSLWKTLAIHYCKEMHSSVLRSRLRSTDKCDPRVRQINTRFGNRDFSAAGPRCPHFLLLCVWPIQSTLVKLDSRMICSAVPTQLLGALVAPRLCYKIVIISIIIIGMCNRVTDL